EAVYHLHNQGSEKKLDLLFASGSEQLSDFQVWVDDQPIVCAYAIDANLPVSWRPPKQTPGIGGQSQLDYPSKQVTPVSFTAVIPPGRHDLRVRYAAAAAMQSSGDSTVYRQFVYVLAPARSWAGFGGLDVTIHLPKSWRVACTTTLSREG